MIGLCIGGPASGQTKSSDYHMLVIPVVQTYALYDFSPKSSPEDTTAIAEYFYYRFERYRWREENSRWIEQGLWLPRTWPFQQMFEFIAQELASMQAFRKLAAEGDPLPVWEAVMKFYTEKKT